MVKVFVTGVPVLLFFTWELPIETYEKYILYPESTDTFLLEMPSGDTIRVHDHTKFVRQSFTEVIDTVYQNAEFNTC